MGKLEVLGFVVGTLCLLFGTIGLIAGYQYIVPHLIILGFTNLAVGSVLWGLLISRATTNTTITENEKQPSQEGE